jgi:Gas vesicle synthesis protein GvpL/GvpF
MTEGCYVYAIQRRSSTLPAGLAGLDNRPLTTVDHEDLEAVTSGIQHDTFRPTAENVMRHEAVVEAVRRTVPAIPVRFGTVLPDAEAVRDALAANYPTLYGDVERLGDKVEMGLSVLWEPPTSMQTEDTAERDEPGEHGTGTRYLRSRFSEYRHTTGLRDRARQVADDVDRVLAGHWLDQRRSILPTPRLVVRVAYLMHPSSLSGFRDAFGELHSKFGDLRFLLSGPWPPYSFITSETTGVSALDRLMDDLVRGLRAPSQR